MTIKAFFILIGLSLPQCLIGQSLWVKVPESSGSSSVKVLPQSGMVESTRKIELIDYPTAYNPSIIEISEGYLLTFRYLEDPDNRPWISHLGVVLLSKGFEPISKPQLLDVRENYHLVPPQEEDPRVFSYNGEIYLIYNDNPIVSRPRNIDRRDIYIAKLSYINNRFVVSSPVKLVHPDMYDKRLWEKNWVPFVWNNQLLLGYSINPHEILSGDLQSGICTPLYITGTAETWLYGVRRGGTPASLVDGQYLAFFHSGKPMASPASGHRKMWHYFMGAYTFADSPPFNITKISTIPINDKEFYVKSDSPKRVIYPGGYVVSGENIYLAYGKDDHELWIATINKKKLMNSMRPVAQVPQAEREPRP